MTKGMNATRNGGIPPHAVRPTDSDSPEPDFLTFETETNYTSAEHQDRILVRLTEPAGVPLGWLTWKSTVQILLENQREPQEIESLDWIAQTMQLKGTAPLQADDRSFELVLIQEMELCRTEEPPDSVGAGPHFTGFAYAKFLEARDLPDCDIKQGTTISMVRVLISRLEG